MDEATPQYKHRKKLAKEQSERAKKDPDNILGVEYKQVISTSAIRMKYVKITRMANGLTYSTIADKESYEQWMRLKGSH